MKPYLLGLCAVCVLGAAVAFSRPKQAAEVRTAFAVAQEARNPWTHAALNNNNEEFQFAIVSDRTGGHRAKIFSQAVDRLNLMQPEFVLSVGDLIEGGNKPTAALEKEWEEFQGYVSRLQMPFFYVPGNHDAAAKPADALWGEKFGRRYYHFVYRNVLFLCLNSNDPPGGGTQIGKEQIEYARRVLAENAKVRWTVVSLHHPIWVANAEKNGWGEVEKALADRPYTVFCGHVHRFQKFVRQGRNYYQLSTTGGSSKVRGVPYGEFDQIVWVTMKKTGPVLAHVLLDSILPDDLAVPESSEKGVARTKQPTHALRGRLFYDGVPAAGAYVVLHPVEGSKGVRADGLVEADGSFTVSTYAAFDGVAEGEYAVTVLLRRPFVGADGRPGPNALPNRFGNEKTTPLRYQVKPGENEMVLDIRK